MSPDKLAVIIDWDFFLQFDLQTTVGKFNAQGPLVNFLKKSRP